MTWEETLLVTFGCGMFLISAAALSGLLEKKTLNFLAVILLMTFVALFHDNFPAWWSTLKWKFGIY